MQVPFLDLKAQHLPLREEISAAIQDVIDASAFAGGPFVAKFEEDFAAFCQCPHAIGVANGTDALWFALLALGVGPGDEVITVPHTFIATAEAISFCGAKPVFVDINEETYTMDPCLLEQAISPRTKAIIPVHIFGQPADMDPILEISRKHGIPVIEDACQAHGAEYKGKRAGSLGVAGCFSFYPGKNLGAFGEAGAVTTHSRELKEKIQVLRDHGQAKKYYHSVVGWNGRMDGIQAAVLRVKLKHLADGNSRRRAHARLYDQLLASVAGVTIPKTADYATPVYHIYAIRVVVGQASRLPSQAVEQASSLSSEVVGQASSLPSRNRDALLKTLTERGIGCGIHYPMPLHLQDAYRSLGLARGAFPVAEKCAAEFLSLPMFPELTSEQVELVVREVKAGNR